MSETGYPFQGQTVTDSMFRAWAAQFAGSRIGSGLTVTASGTTVTLAPGTAIVNGCGYVLDAPLALAAPANTGGARRLWVRLKLDPTAQSVTAGLVAGTGTTEPAWQRTTGGVWEEPIAYVAQAAGSSTVGSVTDVAPRGGSTGGVYTGGETNLTVSTGSGQLWTPAGDYCECVSGLGGRVIVQTSWLVYLGGSNVAVDLSCTDPAGVTRLAGGARVQTTDGVARTYAATATNILTATRPGARVRWKPCCYIEPLSNGGAGIAGYQVTAYGI